MTLVNDGFYSHVEIHTIFHANMKSSVLQKGILRNICLLHFRHIVIQSHVIKKLLLLHFHRMYRRAYVTKTLESQFYLDFKINVKLI